MRFFLKHVFVSPQVFLDAPVIINGLCLRWKGYLSLEKLDGVGSFRFDEDAARIEDMAMQQQVSNQIK